MKNRIMIDTMVTKITALIFVGVSFFLMAAMPTPSKTVTATDTVTPTIVIHATCVPWSSQNAGSHYGDCGSPMPAPTE